MMKYYTKRKKFSSELVKAQLGLSVNTDQFHEPLAVDSTDIEEMAGGIEAPGLKPYLPSLSDTSVNPQISTEKIKDQSNSNNIMGAIPVIGNLAVGVSQIVKSVREKKRQKQYEKLSQLNLETRKKEDALNSYYYTPYMQEGGLTEEELFYNFYNQSEQENREGYNRLYQDYLTKNNALKESWKNLRNEGITNTVKGGIQLATSLLKRGGRKWEEGGSVEPDSNQNTTDIYSSNFLYSSGNNNTVSNNNKVSSDIDEDAELNDLLYQIALEDSKSMEIQDSYLSQELSHLEPAIAAAEKFKMMGLQPSSIKDGKHNVGSKHYEGKALDLGLNTSFGGDKQKMDEFLIWWESGGKNEFPGAKLVDERSHPTGQKVWSGSHYHLEFE